MARIGPEEFLRLALQSRATDIVLTSGRLQGNLTIRSGARTLHATRLPMEALYVLADWFCDRAGLDRSQQMFELGMDSFAFGGARVRVGRTTTATGPLVRVRLQLPQLLEESHERFLEGAFGGLDVLPFLQLSRGLLIVTGEVSAGKTSALYHLLSACARPSRDLVSEVRELELRLVRHHPGQLPRGWEEALATEAVVAFDEMEEAAKLHLAARVARSRLVLVTVTAPCLAFALRKVMASGLDPAVLVGVLRVGWEELPEGGRRPSYRFYPVGERGRERCAVCRVERAADGPCPGCGLPAINEFLDREVLRKAASPEGFRALDRLEAEWVT